MTDANEDQFRAVDGGRIECLACRTLIDPAAVEAGRVGRREGMTDPDEQLLVVPVTCPGCGAAGRLLLGYGPQASPEDADVAVALDR